MRSIKVTQEAKYHMLNRLEDEINATPGFEKLESRSRKSVFTDFLAEILLERSKEVLDMADKCGVLEHIEKVDYINVETTYGEQYHGEYVGRAYADGLVALPKKEVEALIGASSEFYGLAVVAMHKIGDECAIARDAYLLRETMRAHYRNKANNRIHQANTSGSIADLADLFSPDFMNKCNAPAKGKAPKSTAPKFSI